MVKTRGHPANFNETASGKPISLKMLMSNTGRNIPPETIAKIPQVAANGKSNALRPILRGGRYGHCHGLIAKAEDNVVIGKSEA